MACRARSPPRFSALLTADAASCPVSANIRRRQCCCAFRRTHKEPRRVPAGIWTPMEAVCVATGSVAGAE
eukprot:1408056-Rhodomonas_salina.2